MVTDPAFVSRSFCSVPNHHTLKAWQHAQRLAVDCAKIAQSFPGEYRKFLDIAWGSFAEVETALSMARDVGYLEPAEFGRLEALATETSKTLFGLLRKVSQSALRPPRSG